jgi:hypothetical protein
MVCGEQCLTAATCPDGPVLVVAGAVLAVQVDVEQLPRQSAWLIACA